MSILDTHINVRLPEETLHQLGFYEVKDKLWKNDFFHVTIYLQQPDYIQYDVCHEDGNYWVARGCRGTLENVFLEIEQKTGIKINGPITRNINDFYV